VRGDSSTTRAELRAGIGLTLVVAIIAAALGTSAPQATARGKRTKRRTITIARGLTLTTITKRNPPNKIRVLTMNPSSQLTLDVALANETIPGHEQTSAMARRHGAIAAINGDYTLRPVVEGAGRPIDTFAADGDLVTSPLIWGRNFAISADEQNVYFGHAQLSVEMFENDTGKSWKIHGWNDWDDESADGLVGYSPVGGQVFRPLADACSVRLYPSSPPSWSTEGAVTRLYTVDEVKCSKHRLARHGGVVLSVPRYDKQASKLQESLLPSETVTIKWSLGWPGVLDTIGGNPDVVENGQLASGECTVSYFCRRNPRTGVGVREDGAILLVTVDGRQEKSVGMTPDQFGKLFQSLGATWALNMDGGGSTTMVVRNDVVNVPSDGYERSVGSALLVLPGPDSGEPTPLPYESPTTVPTDVPTPVPSPTGPSSQWTIPEGVRAPDSGCETLIDPGSTGGMLDALSRGELAGPPVNLPRSLRPALKMFRTAAGCPAQRFAH
jgi:hypothetical protein